MSQSKILLKNVSSLGIIQIVNYIFPLITVPYISRVIGPDGYGIVNYATAFIGYFTILISYGFDLTATRKISKNSHDAIFVSQIISEVTSSRIILFFISLVFFCISLFLFKPIQKDILVSIILFVGCIGAVLSPQYIYQGFQELAIFAKLNFVRGILNTILVFVLIKKSSDYIFLPVLSTSFLIFINLFLLLYSFKKFGIQIKMISLKKTLKLINEERMIFFSTVVISLYTSTNTIVLGFFAETREIGYFTASQNFLAIVNSILSTPLALALYPYIGKAFSVSKENGINVVNRIAPVVVYLSFFASLGLLLLAPLCIKLIYGHQFDASIKALQILSFLPLIIGLSNVFGIQLMLNMGLDKLFFRTTLIASIFGMVLNVFMSKYYGFIGTAWNCLIVECFVTVLMYIALRRENINILNWEYFKPASIILMIKNIKR